MAIGFTISIAAALYILVQSGRAVEGQIIAISDDGIDRLYAVYYEDGPDAYELDFTVKSKGPAGRLQSGDSITLILGRTPPLGPRCLILLPTASSLSPP